MSGEVTSGEMTSGGMTSGEKKSELQICTSDKPAQTSQGQIQSFPIKMEVNYDLRMSSSTARQIMFDQYQPWVLSTYGDAAKTKTITAKKYARIIALLRHTNGYEKVTIHHPMSGPSEPTGSEAAKFRLWVKSKGFHLGPPPGHPEAIIPNALETLYLPTGTDKVSYK